jgi:hypothetical protein
VWATAIVIAAAAAVSFPTIGTIGTASAQPAVLPVGSPGSNLSWAYGAYRTVNASGNGHDAQGPYGYSVRAYYGIQVILNQTNVSSTVSEVEIQRTVGATAYWTYCRPTCGAALVSANLTVKAVEFGAGFTNLTSTATVYESGVAVPAVGLLDSHAQVRESVVVSAQATLHSLMGSRTSTLNANQTATAAMSIAFVPALGLYPADLTTAGPWNSSSGYTSAGSWNRSAQGAYTNLSGTTATWTNSSSGSVTGAGNVSLTGADAGPIGLDNGTLADALTIAVSGPFSVREGMLFVPLDADLLGRGPQGAPTENGPAEATESAGTTYIDVGGPALPHVGLVTSASTFTSGSTGGSIVNSATPALQPALLPTTVPAAESSGAVTLQAQPEPVASAQQSSACLRSGTCPIPAGSSPVLRGLGLLALGVVVVSVLAVALVAARRRTPPAPPRPQAQLYPAPGPAPAAPSGPAVPPGARGETAAPEDDPLSHLW